MKKKKKKLHYGQVMLGVIILKKQFCPGHTHTYKCFVFIFQFGTNYLIVIVVVKFPIFFSNA